MMRIDTLASRSTSTGTTRRANTASLVAEYAERALLTELMLTPKPGLVDQRNCGAHDDMNLQTFLVSTRAIAEWFPRFVEIGHTHADLPARDFLPHVRPAGVQCEKAMFRATSGVNTHKGAIFSLGLLCAAAGRLLARRINVNREQLCCEVAGMCVGLVGQELARARHAETAGERIYRRYGLAGARGEAASGYAIVRNVALPVYDRLRRDGVREETALLQVLLHLLAINGDTNVVSRGGLAGLDYVRARATILLLEGGALSPDGVEQIEAFDDALIERHLSPGGSADLLGVTWFLAQFPETSENVRRHDDHK